MLHCLLTGYNVKPPVILETTFDPSRVTLHWKDPENICSSTEYRIILYNTTTKSNDTYCTTNTNLTISSTMSSLTDNHACMITSNDPYKNYSTKNTNFTINSTVLSLTANYTYMIKVMGRKEKNSNISDPFTLGENQVKCLIVYNYS